VSPKFLFFFVQTPTSHELLFFFWLTVLSSDSELSDDDVIALPAPVQPRFRTATQLPSSLPNFDDNKLNAMSLAELEDAILQYGRKKGTRAEMIKFLQAVRETHTNAPPPDLESRITKLIKANTEIWERILLGQRINQEHLFTYLRSEGLKALTKDQLRAYATRNRVTFV
jgi:hypothetical protein